MGFLIKLPCRQKTAEKIERKRTQHKLELCIYNVCNVYSLVPNIITCLFAKSEFVSSCSRPAIGLNMAAGSHFVCPKLTFDGISGHFR